MYLDFHVNHKSFRKFSFRKLFNVSIFLVYVQFISVYKK